MGRHERRTFTGSGDRRHAAGDSSSLGALRRVLESAEESGAGTELLDLTQFLSRDERPYLDGRVVGLISTAGGGQGAANANRAMMDTVHALRGVVVPLMVAIPGTWRISDDAGNITDEGVNRRLDRLGRLVVEPAQSLSAPMESAA